MKYADVIIPLSLKNTFTYSISEQLEPFLEIGMRVLVQFGQKKIYTAIVKSIHQQKPEYETKDIISIIDNESIVNEKHLKFWEWISEYYMANIGDVYTAAMPVSLRIESQTQIFLIKEIIDDELSENEQIIVDALKSQKTLTINLVSKLLNSKNAISIVNKLIKKNIVEIYEHLHTNYKPKFVKLVRISAEIKSNEDLTNIFNSLTKKAKQSELLLAYCALSKLRFIEKNIVYREVLKKDLLEKANLTISVLNSLYKKNILVEYEKQISRFGEIVGYEQNINDLSEIQQKANEDINEQFISKDVVLLHGITSSGKTEIYIHQIKKCIDEGRQVLYLLPEIALTTQIIDRLRNAFGDIVGIYHSKFNDSERAEIWTRINKNTTEKTTYKIILGVRSAIFLPFENLGLIIIDEEHETTYKQFDPAPRYHARDAAIVLAGMFKAKVLMGTATPSVESFYNAKNDKYGYVWLNQRHKNIDLPEIEIADIRDASKNNRMKSIFHPQMIENIKKAIDNGEQIILFQNRRGFAPYIECTRCGWISKCVQCDVSLTYHIDSNSLICHYCGYKREIPRKCDNCNENTIETRGFGTQKVEDEIKIFFPKVKVARLDLDVAKRKHGYEEVLNAFDKKMIDILVGTQMITKGLDFENVSVVGVLNADNLLNFPDFRSFERSFQLITQVSGRAGRSKERGKVVIQTTSANHKILKYISENDYFGYYEEEITERARFNYPPFVRLVRINIKHKNPDLVKDFSKLLGSYLQKYFANNLLGPYEPLIKRIQNYYLMEILIKMDSKISTSKAKKLILEITDKLNSEKNFTTVQVNFNVDPF